MQKARHFHAGMLPKFLSREKKNYKKKKKKKTVASNDRAPTIDTAVSILMHAGAEGGALSQVAAVAAGTFIALGFLLATRPRTVCGIYKYLHMFVFSSLAIVLRPPLNPNFLISPSRTRSHKQTFLRDRNSGRR
jgi:amino acid permease